MSFSQIYSAISRRFSIKFLTIFSLLLSVNCYAQSSNINSNSNTESTSLSSNNTTGEAPKSSDFKIRQAIKFVPASEEEKDRVKSIPENETELLEYIIEEAKTSKKLELSAIAHEKIANFQPSFQNYYDLAVSQGAIGDFSNAVISCSNALEEGSGEELLYMYCHVLKGIFLGASDLYEDAADELMIVLKSDDVETKVFVFQDLVPPPVYTVLKTNIENEIKNDSENYRWLLYLGRLYQTVGDYKNAIEVYKDGYDKSNEFSFLKLISDCYDKAGDEKSAKYYHDKYESILHDIIFK